MYFGINTLRLSKTPVHKGAVEVGPTGFVTTEMTGLALEGTIPNIHGISGRASKMKG
jgi:hypothetical protein